MRTVNDFTNISNIFDLMEEVSLSTKINRIYQLIQIKSALKFEDVEEKRGYILVRTVVRTVVGTVSGTAETHVSLNNCT